jgi:malate dehydrogenase
VTVVGAGNVGATVAELLLLHEIADVTLVDIAEGLPQGKALDLLHARSVERFGPVVAGTNEFEATAGSDMVIVTAGLPRKPGMTRDDLLVANKAIVRSVIADAVEMSPDAVVLCVTNPLDVMTYLAWKESGLPSNRVLGMGGVLDSARFAYAIADHTGIPVSQIDALACGAHGDAMVPLPRFTKVRGVPLTELLPEAAVASLVERTIFGGAEVVSLLKTGSAFYAPAASVARMVKAILSGDPVALPSCVYLDGEYGITDVYMSVPAKLGPDGVVDIPELDLNDDELAALRSSAATVSEAIDSLGLRG